MKTRPIGIFDSGVGGLTVFKKIREALPGEDLVYFGDTARVPYGSKSVQVIRSFSREIASFLENLNVKMIVIACNTASAFALSLIRSETSLPVVGVIAPGVRAAVKSAGNGSIGVIGTRGTINSGAYQKQIIRLRADAKIVAQPCPLLVPIVEENLMHSEIARVALKMYLSELKKIQINSLILACTHYPLLIPLIQDFLGPHTILIDSAQETAFEVKDVLQARRILNDQTHNGNEKFFVTDSTDAFSEIAEKFLGRSIQGECYLHQWETDI